MNPHPRLFLVARDLHDRSESAFDFLIESGVPITIVRVSVHEDSAGRRFVDVEGEHEPDFAPVSPEEPVDHTRIRGRRVRIDDLLEHDFLDADDRLVWDRPRVGDHYETMITENGAIRLEDGREFSSPSRAAMEAANIASYDGWYAWKVVRVGKTLNELRIELAQRRDHAE